MNTVEENNDTTSLQNVMIGEELLSSIRLLKTGLRELNRMDSSTDFFHLPILLLASGFERMMKTVICCHHLKTTGKYPKRDVFPNGKKGHDLVWMLNKIANECYSDTYLTNIPAAISDIKFLRDDTKLSKIIKILSDFGQSARYYNLNVVLGEQNPGPSPDDEWQELQMEILQEDPLWKSRIKNPKENTLIHNEINKAMTVHCEKLARALSRLFTIGGLGAQGRQISIHTNHFLKMRDEQLGKSDYENISIF